MCSAIDKLPQFLGLYLRSVVDAHLRAILIHGGTGKLLLVVGRGRHNLIVLAGFGLYNLSLLVGFNLLA